MESTAFCSIIEEVLSQSGARGIEIIADDLETGRMICDVAVRFCRIALEYALQKSRSEFDGLSNASIPVLNVHGAARDEDLRPLWDSL